MNTSTTVSDLSGAEISADDSAARARVIVEYADANRGLFVLDVTVEEADELAAKGRHVPLRTVQDGGV
jgi:hypothetical protein